MYAAGARHPNKEPSVRFLERVARDEVEATVDAQTLHEVLDRYQRIGRWKEGRLVHDRGRIIFPLVIPVTAEVLEEARGVIDRYPGLSAPDGLRAALVIVHDLEGVVTFHREFDRLREVRRFRLT